MMIIFIFFTIVMMASTNPNSIPRPSAQQEECMDEMRFWRSLTCQAGSQRSFRLYETPRIRSNRYLRDFYEALANNVHGECDSTMSTKLYLVDEDTNNTNHLNLFYREESLQNLPEIQLEPEDIESTASEREILFPYKDIEIILVMVENSVTTLMNGSIFNEFNNRRHVLVLIISESNDPDAFAGSLKNIIVVFLQRLWRERRVLNVFFAAPFSSLGRRIWFYDPFFINVITGERGKIIAMRVESIRTVDRIKDLKGYTLNIGMFEAAPASIKLDSRSNNTFLYTRESQGFGGIDGMTMTAIAEHMNFALNIVPPTDGVEFGHVYTNGTFVGTIGDAAYHKIDIGFNSMYTKIYAPTQTERNGIELTDPIDFDRLCVIVPRARKIPRWLRTFYCFDPIIWVCLVLTQILVALVWYFLRKFRVSPRKNLGHTTSYRALLLNTVLLFVGVPLQLNTSQAERLVLSALLFLGLTVIGVFTGTLYHSFTQEMHYKEVNTLKEVDAAGIAIGTASPNLIDVFGIEENEGDADEVKSLRRKFQIFNYDGSSTIEKTAYQRNVASLSRQHSFRVLMYRYVDDVGSSLLHLVEECPRSYYLSYVVPKDSVYIDRLNLLIRRLQEAGLPPLWNSVTANKLATENNAKESLTSVKSFNIHDMQTAFFLLFIGHLVAIVFLIGEISYNRKRKTLTTTRHRVRS